MINLKIKAALGYILWAILFSFFICYAWFWINDKLYTIAFILLLLCLIFYFTFLFICNAYNLYIFTSISFIMIGTKLHFSKNDEYIGGVGASAFYLGIPHLVLVLGLGTLFISHLKKENNYNNITIVDKKDIPLLIFLLFATVSAFIAPYKQASINQLNLYLTLFFVYKIWRIVVNSYTKEIINNIILKSLLFIVFIQLFLVILQIIVDHELGLNFIGEGQMTRRAGTPFPAVTGTFGHTGPLSLFFSICSVIFFPYLMAEKNRAPILGFVLSFLGIILTFSRTSLLVIFIILLIEWFLIKKFYREKILKSRVVLISIVVSLFILLFSPLIIDRFLSLVNNTVDSQISNRWIHYAMAWEYIKNNPIIGYGLNNWSYTTKTSFVTTSELYDQFFYDNPVHNLYLLLWYEGGVFLLLSFLNILIQVIKKLMTNVKQNIINIGLVCSILVIMLYGFFGWALFVGSQLLYMLFFIIAFSNSDFIEGHMEEK